jgi:hypothetical protein
MSVLQQPQSHFTQDMNSEPIATYLADISNRRSKRNSSNSASRKRRSAGVFEKLLSKIHYNYYYFLPKLTMFH